MIEFRTYGPFPIPDIKNKSFELGETFNLSTAGLNNSCGVYIFVDDSSGLPFYVGKTTRNSFGTRLSNHLNGRTRLRNIMFREPIKASLFIIAVTSDGVPIQAGETEPYAAAITRVETMLIGACYEINNDLCNVSGLNSYKAIHVPGYLNSGPADACYDESAKSLEKLLHRRLS